VRARRLRGAHALTRPPQAKKLSERLKRSGAVAGYTNECNPFGDTNLTDRCAPRPRSRGLSPAVP
jgi:hypothetical protein